MNQNEIIEMARQAGLPSIGSMLTEALQQFAKLVAAKERERVEDLCMRGTQLAVLVAKAEEREACAKVCEKDDSMRWSGAADAIRARGEA